MLQKGAKEISNFADCLPKLIADKLRPHSPKGADMIKMIDIDAPLTLCFCFACTALQLLSYISGERFIMNYFGVLSWSDFKWFSLLSYWTVFGQIFGHSSWQHLSGNMIHMLLVGPPCERVFGMVKLMQIILCTAVATAAAHIMFGKAHSTQLGASGVVFMLILLNSLVEAKLGRIPLTFICQLLVWCYGEVVAQTLGGRGHSHLAHLMGAVVGAFAGFYLHEQRVMEYAGKIGKKWLASARSKSNNAAAAIAAAAKDTKDK